MIEQDMGWQLDNSYARLPQMLFTVQHPVPVSTPNLVILNEALAAELGLDAQALRSEEGVAMLAGNEVPPGAKPLAQAYAGHQFGSFTMLGDGRAILLGEQLTPAGERFDVQLKGSGVTPYSRRGDGRAALGPMLREYMISEAMHALRIPTTRSLAVVTTGEPVYREDILPGAILTRIAASHLRVGTFQFVAHWGSVDQLRALADYAIARHFPKIDGPPHHRYLSLLEHVIERQAYLIARWQLVGFVHGVMNTDNMTISGETIDYGPCAFMDEYDQKTVFSSIDTHGRYAYGNQPYIAGWNLARFAESLLALLADEQAEAVALAQKAIERFSPLYQTYVFTGMLGKLGLSNEEEGDEELIHDLLKAMEKYKADFTNTFRALTLQHFDDTALFVSPEFADWHERWQARLQRQEDTIDPYAIMKQHNPAVIPRNHRVEEALEAAVERHDYSVMNQFLEQLSAPYAYSEEQLAMADTPPTTPYPYVTYCGT